MAVLQHDVQTLQASKSSKGYQLFVLQLTFLIVVWILAGLRAHVRIFVVKKIALGDYVMLLALVSFYASSFFSRPS